MIGLFPVARLCMERLGEGGEERRGVKGWLCIIMVDLWMIMMVEYIHVAYVLRTRALLIGKKNKKQAIRMHR